MNHCLFWTSSLWGLVISPALPLSHFSASLTCQLVPLCCASSKRDSQTFCCLQISSSRLTLRFDFRSLSPAGLSVSVRTRYRPQITCQIISPFGVDVTCKEILLASKLSQRVKHATRPMLFPRFYFFGLAETSPGGWVGGFEGGRSLGGMPPPPLPLLRSRSNPRPLQSWRKDGLCLSACFGAVTPPLPWATSLSSVLTSPQ